MSFGALIVDSARSCTALIGILVARIRGLSSSSTLHVLLNGLL